MDLKRIVAKGMRRLLQPPAVTASQVDKTARICSGTQVTGSRLDRYSYVGHDGFVLQAVIGPFCSVADNCRIGGAAHPVEYVSTSPVFHEGKNIMGRNFACHPAPRTPETVLEADVWLGANVTVKSGVRIGCGAVIGAGSVVTRDVPPYEIWAGVPARKIRDRFAPQMAQGLLASRWWEWDTEKLQRFAPLFDRPEEFLAALEETE